MNRRLAAVLAAAALLLGGAGIATGAAAPQAVACSYDGATLTCPLPQVRTTATRTVTRTATRTVTATPSATPTPPTSTSTAPPVSSGWPDATNTGVPAGTTLRTVKNGDTGAGWKVENSTFYVTTPGTVITGFDIPFVAKVIANNVTIRNSRIHAASYYTVNVSDPPTYYSGLTLTDVDVDGEGATALGTPGIAVMGNEGATYLRVNFHGFGSSGPRLATGDTLQDSWIHDFVCQQPNHSAGATANDGGSNIKIVHNTIDINTGAAGCASTAIGLDQDFGKYDNVLISGNHVDGGAYCMYVAQYVPNNSYGQSTNIRVEGNTFGRKYYPNCGQYGPAAQVATGNGNTFIGNVWDDGSPVNP